MQPLLMPIERQREEGLSYQMTATAGLLAGQQDYVRTVAVPNRTKETIQNLVHDLRQPLSAIEAIAYYLEMTLPAEQLSARRYLARLQELVCQSGTILSDAVEVAGRS